MNHFTHDERNLMCIYNADTRDGMMQQLRDMRKHLDADEVELQALVDSTLDKLDQLRDDEFAALDLVPDFGDMDD